MYCDHSKYPTVYHWLASNDYYNEIINEFDCVECEGSGRIWDPDDPRDPYEGNKLRNRIECPTCKGKGVGPVEPYLKFYSESKERYVRDQALAIEKQRKQESLIKKLKDFLTEDEFARITVS